MRRAWAGFALLLGAAALLTGPAASAQTRLERFRMAEEPRVSERVIEQGQWASELVFALGLADALPEDSDQADLFGLLCAEQSEYRLGPGGRMIPSDAPYRVSVLPTLNRRPDEPGRRR